MARKAECFTEIPEGYEPLADILKRIKTQHTVIKAGARDNLYPVVKAEYACPWNGFHYTRVFTTEAHVRQFLAEHKKSKQKTPKVLTTMRKIRLQFDFTKKKMASAFGVTEPYYAAIESGRAVPSLVRALMFARVLGVSVEELFPLEELEAQGRLRRAVTSSKYEG